MKERLITELMYLAMMVQSNTDYCVFIHFSGHVDQIDIRICKSKEKYNEGVARSQFYINSDEYSVKRAEEAKTVLIDILENGEIDYDLCEVEEIVEVHQQYNF